MDPKQIILQARAKGIPDNVTYDYLTKKGLIPGGQSKLPVQTPVTPTVQGKQVNFNTGNQMLDTAQSILPNIGIGIGSALGKFVTGVPEAASRLLGAGANAVGATGLGQSFQNNANKISNFSNEIFQKPFEQNLNTLSGKTGTAIGTVAPYLLGGGEVNATKGAVAGTVDALAGTSRLGQFAGGLTKLGANAGIEGANAFGTSYLQSGGNLDQAENVGITTAGVTAALGPVGYLLRGVGSKILETVIKPSRADFEDGFSMDTVKKFNLGGSLSAMLDKTQLKMNELTQQLNQKLANSTAKINLNQVFEDTVRKLDAEKMRNFGSNNRIGSAIDQLRDEISGVSPRLQEPTRVGAVENVKNTVTKEIATPPPTKILPVSPQTPITKVPINGKTGRMLPSKSSVIGTNPGETKYLGATDLRQGVPQTVSETTESLQPKFAGATDLRYPTELPGVSIPSAQVLKQAAGSKGAWHFGAQDPESTAQQAVYNAFYKELKLAIERNSPEGVREINKQLSQLIPVQHAIIRRIPVVERNNLLSLQDLVTLSMGALNPKALGGFGLSLGQKSGTVGNALSKLGESGRLFGSVDKNSPAYKKGYMLGDTAKKTPNKQGGFLRLGRETNSVARKELVRKKDEILRNQRFSPAQKKKGIDALDKRLGLK